MQALGGNIKCADLRIESRVETTDKDVVDLNFVSSVEYIFPDDVPSSLAARADSHV